MKVQEKAPALLILRDGTREETEEELLLEYRLDIYVNGKKELQCVCTATELEALTVGRLFTAGIIDGIEEIEVCEIREEERRADVRLRKGTKSGNQAKKASCVWKPEWIFKLADSFAEDTLLHSRTSCTHSCLLAREDKVLYRAEDIGRHNAMDKVIGRMLLDRVDPGQCILYTSGRIPTDMMEKVARSGVPVAVSNAVPTRDGVLLAEREGVTLIARARQNRMKVYTDFLGKGEDK